MIDELSDKQLRAAFNEWLTNGTSMDSTLGLTKARHNYYQQQVRGANRFARIQLLMEDIDKGIHNNGKWLRGNR